MPSPDQGPLFPVTYQPGPTVNFPGSASGGHDAGPDPSLRDWRRAQRAGPVVGVPVERPRLPGGGSPLDELLGRDFQPRGGTTTARPTEFDRLLRPPSEFDRLLEKTFTPRGGTVSRVARAALPFLGDVLLFAQLLLYSPDAGRGSDLFKPGSGKGPKTRGRKPRPRVPVRPVPKPEVVLEAPRPLRPRPTPPPLQPILVHAPRLPDPKTEATPRRLPEPVASPAPRPASTPKPAARPSSKPFPVPDFLPEWSFFADPYRLPDRAPRPGRTPTVRRPLTRASAPRVLSDPFTLAQPQPQPGSQSCQCTAKREKQKRKRKQRDECRRGTYVETARGLIKSPKEKITCR
jgi:hypothetical protein